MRPASGLIKPKTSFRMELFPDPATPKRALVSPRAREKETSLSTGLSSNARTTSSKTTTGPEDPMSSWAGISLGSVGTLAIDQHYAQDTSQEEINHYNQHR